MSAPPSLPPARRRFVLPLAALLLVVLRLVLPPAAIESAYSRGLFPLLRTVGDALLGWVPFPLFYLFWLGALLVIASWLWRVFRRRGAARWRELGYGLLRGASLLVVWFLLGWGFNYGRRPVTEVMEFTPYDLSLDELRQRVHGEAAALGELRDRIRVDTHALVAADLVADPEPGVRTALAAALATEGYPTPGRPRARRLYPRGILLRLSTAGVYWPFVAEGHVDAGLHPVQVPSVMAHELAHAYGFGDEGVCSFWAVLAAEHADDPRLRYPLRLGYWRRLAGRLRVAEPEAYWAWRQTDLHPGIRNDLAAIYANAARYEDIAPAVRDATYGAYLRAQGIHDGLLNYGTVIRLVEGERRRRR